MTEEEVFPICQDCRHSMSMHVGLQSMGGGHVEPVGCTHMTGYDKGVLCDCMRYDENGEY